VSFTAEFASVLAVLGPNGAGKSTLLDAIAGFHPHDGQILVDGAPLKSLDRRERARQLAYVPQVSRLDSPMLVSDVVGQGRFAHRGTLRGQDATDEEAIQRAMESTDTQRFADRAFTALSYGERRRVLLARALATGARVILLDEPSSSLDIAQMLGLFALLRRLADSGHCIVVVLHVLDEALRCADRALLLAEGRCVAVGPVREVVAQEPVARVFGVEIVPEGGMGYRLAARTA
jgi:iron complex transport system ATP-binding protein